MTLTPLSLAARLLDLDTYDAGTDAPAQVTLQRSNLGDKQNPPVAIVVSTVTVDAVATHRHIFAWSVGHAKDMAGTLTLGVRFGCALANAIIDAMGGTTYTGTYKRYLLQMSRDGGASWCTSCWLEGVTILPGGDQRGITIATKDSWDGYARGVVDHVTYNGAPLRNVLDSTPGNVPVVVSGSTGTTLSGANFPDVGGLSRFTPGGPTLSADGQALLHYSIQTDSAFTASGDTPVNADIWGDTPANGVLSVLRAAAGQYNATDTAPLAARAHYHVDPATRTVYAGVVGTTSVIDLVATNGTDYEVDQTTTARFDLASLAITPGNQGMRGRFTGLFGSSNHGFPDGYTITGISTLFDWIASGNIFITGTAQEWYTCLPIVCVSTGNGGGGVGFMLDKTWYRMSQAMDVTCFALDGTRNGGGTGNENLYVGTPRGVFTWTVDPALLTSRPTWTRVGAMDAPILDIEVVAHTYISSVDLVTIWALADTGSGTTGVMQAPPIGSENNTSLGFGGWSRIYHGGSLAAMAGGLGHLYTYDSTDATNLLYLSSGAPVKIAIPGGAGVVGIDYLPTYTAVVIRTTAGSAGLYAIDFTVSATTLIDLNSDHSFADTFGPLTVNSIVVSNAANLNGTVCTLLAATDQGMWFTSITIAAGHSMAWQQGTAQTGVGSTSISMIHASPGQYMLGNAFEQVLVADANYLAISRSGGIWFFDVLASGLDLGPFWWALAFRVLSAYPDTGVGGFGNGTLAGTVTGFGQIIGVSSSDPAYEPDEFVWLRTLTPGRNEWVYDQDVLDSPAPYYAVEQQDVTDISADDSRGPIAASEAGALAAFRLMAELSRPALTLPLSGMSYWAQEAALPKIITGNLAHLTATSSHVGEDGTITVVCDWSDLPVYVQDYLETFDTQHGIMAVQMTVGTLFSLLDTDAQLFEEIIQGTAYGLNRSNRYAVKK